MHIVILFSTYRVTDKGRTLGLRKQEIPTPHRMRSKIVSLSSVG